MIFSWGVRERFTSFTSLNRQVEWDFHSLEAPVTLLAALPQASGWDKAAVLGGLLRLPRPP